MATHATARLRRSALLHGIYVILNEDCRIVELASAVLEAGVRVVQYRAKAGIVADDLRRLRTLTRERDALLIVNDEWRAAVEFECDGVHLGPGDDGFAKIGPVRAALVDRLIGLSCCTPEEVQHANAGDADYLGIGSVYATSSKGDAGAPIGLDGLRRLAAGTALPVAAIGGITAETLAGVRASGVAMAAVISAIAGAEQAARAASDLVSRWNDGE
jgi:thiamine-phosphate pyrophosphorylase